ncbi:MAG: AMP-dependent synthetase [Planctomycetaceae bacterium]|nr:AMP-dependent synthetase [Planctomycetaceae bacterium]
MIAHVGQYLQETSARWPAAPAIIGAETSVTFGQLAEQANQIAAALIDVSPLTKCPIAVLLPRAPATVAVFQGVLWSGHFYVPLDPQSPRERLGKILTDLSPLAVVLSQQDHLHLAPILPPHTSVIELEATLLSAPTDIRKTIQLRMEQTIDTDPVYLKYTSGSTGHPKGVVLPHRAVTDYIEWAAATYQLGPDDAIGNQAAFTFDVSVQDIYLCLKTGAPLYLIPESHFSFPANLVDYLSTHKISYFCWVPSVLVSVSKLNLLAGVDLPQLRWITVLGEVMPTRHFQYWAAHCPTATLVNTYGPTETAIASTYYVLDRAFEDDQPLPIGTACRNTEILILDEQQLPVSDQQTGEICIRGSSLALGYWNDPEKTAHAFPEIVHRKHYPEKMYRTGDLGYWNERGELMFVGRLDTQIKHLGYRIELGEIESAASRVVEIHRACVLYDASRQQLILCYESGRELDRGALRKELAETLPAYMLPRVLLHMPTFPLNPNGKVDRQQLQSHYLSQTTTPNGMA